MSELEHIFMFDECIGKPVMEQLRQAVDPVARFIHVCDEFKSGALDNDWIPQIASRGGHVVITSDGGQHSKRTEKLPLICAEYGVTHVVMSGTLHQRQSHEKLAALIQVWNEIAKLHAEPPGGKYVLRYKSVKGHQAKVVIALEKFVPKPRRVEGEAPPAQPPGKDNSKG